MLSQEALRDILCYSPDTGIFTGGWPKEQIDHSTAYANAARIYHGEFARVS